MSGLRRRLARLSERAPQPRKRGEPPVHELGQKARIERLRGLIGEVVRSSRTKERDVEAQVQGDLRRRRFCESGTPRAEGAETYRAEGAAAKATGLPGESEATEHGILHRVRGALPADHQHGRVRIARARKACPSVLSRLALDEGLRSIDPSSMLLLDTETTGLAGGTGTLPFLIGLAWFEEDSLQLEQLLLPAPGQEAPMLRRLSERMERASCVLSYNGKAFDWPLLRTRFVLNRIPVRPPSAHLDLLHCARRVFARRLGQVRLTHLEARVLGMHRDHDIDGALIPELFWQFVRTGRGSRLAPVIEHNAHDLIALAAIVVTLVDRYQQPRPEHEPEDQLGVAQVAARARDEERADQLSMSAAEAGGSEAVTADALWLGAELARRRRDVEQRHRRLTQALAVQGLDDRRRSRIHLALAKLYEHELKDLEQALIHATQTEPAEAASARDRRVFRIVARMRRRQDMQRKRKKERSDGDAGMD